MRTDKEIVHMKKIFSFLMTLVILVLLITYSPQLLHTCTDCDKVFVGTGYSANVIADFFSEEDGVLCEECAKKHHALSVGLGKSLDEYKRPMELNPLVVIEHWTK